MAMPFQELCLWSHYLENSYSRYTPSVNEQGECVAGFRKDAGKRKRKQRVKDGHQIRTEKLSHNYLIIELI
jgi:hypothetical protein